MAFEALLNELDRVGEEEEQGPGIYRLNKL